MTQSLLDCNILSELRKGVRGSEKVRSWFDAQAEDDLFVSVITLGELSAGIARIGERDPEQARHLEAWLGRTKRHYADRILPVTAAIADRWGRLCPKQPLPTADGLLAATALEHDLCVATRNIVDFERAGVRLINPFG